MCFYNAQTFCPTQFWLLLSLFSVLFIIYIAFVEIVWTCALHYIGTDCKDLYVVLLHTKIHYSGRLCRFDNKNARIHSVVFLFVWNKQLGGWSGVQWHNVCTKFMKLNSNLEENSMETWRNLYTFTYMWTDRQTGRYTFIQNGSLQTYFFLWHKSVKWLI